jgi:hypothetical protein
VAQHPGHASDRRDHQPVFVHLVKACAVVDRDLKSLTKFLLSGDFSALAAVLSSAARRLVNFWSTAAAPRRHGRISVRAFGLRRSATTCAAHPRRVWVERGIYMQPNGKYAVCVRRAVRVWYRAWVSISTSRAPSARR